MRKQSSWQAFLLVALLGLAIISLPATAQTNFGSVNIGDSTTASVTVSIASAGTLGSVAVVTQGVPNLDFTSAVGGTCAAGAAYAVNATCTVSVIFSPKHVGRRYGAVVLADGSGNVLAMAHLQGTGVGPQTTFLPATQSAIPNSQGEPYSLGFAVDGSGNVYIAYVGNTSVSKGTLQSNGGFDWTPVGSGFNNPITVGVDGAGNIYVFEGPWNGTYGAVYKETLSGGSYTQRMIAEGFPVFSAMTVDGAGNVYIADQGVDNVTQGIDIPTAVYKETLQPDGTYLQAAIGSGWVFPSSLAVDGSGNLYVTDAGSVSDGGNIPAGVYKEVLQPDGSYIQSVIGSEWVALNGMAVDGIGNVFIAGDKCPSGCASGVFKETLQPDGSYAESTVDSGWTWPAGVAVDGLGNVYVVDGGSGQAVGGVRPSVSRETPQKDGSYFHATIGGGWNDPGDLRFAAVDASGNVYVADYVKIGSWNVAVFKEDLADPPSLDFDTTPPGSTSADSPQTVTVTNLGNAELNFLEAGYPADFPEKAGAEGGCASNTSLAAEASCKLTIDFTPVTPVGGSASLALTESVTVTTDTLNSTAEQTLTVNGTESNLVAAAPVFSVPTGTYTTAKTVTLSDSTANAVIYYTTNGTTPTSGSTQYASAITVSATETIQAIAEAPNYIQSGVSSATYTINLPVPDFTISGTAVTIAAGATTGNTSAITVTPSGGFTGSVALTAAIASSPTNAQDLPTLSFGSTSPVSITGTAAGTAALGINTTAAGGCIQSAQMHRRPPWFAGGGALLACVLLIGIRAKRRIWRTALALLALLAVFSGGVVACNGSGSGGSSTCNAILAGTTAGTYTVTVTGTSGTLAETGTVTITVR